MTVAKGKVICLEQVGLPVLPEWLGGDGELKPVQQGAIANWSGLGDVTAEGRIWV